MKKEPIKLFATDMDGTLLDHNNSFDRQKMALVLEKIKKINGHFVLATGNQIKRIDRMFDGLDPKNEVISYVSENGALVASDGKLINQSVIDPNKVAYLYGLIPRFQTPPDLLMFASQTSSYMPEWQPVVKDQNLKIFSTGTINEFYPGWRPIKSVSEITEPIDKISLYWHDYDGQQLLDEIQNDPVLQGLQTLASGYGAIDIVNGEVDKAFGLKILAEKLALAPEQMAAFGDGMNDLAMLKYVGHPYVMPNASDDLKENSPSNMQWAANDNRHDGVLDTILEIIEEQRKIKN